MTPTTFCLTFAAGLLPSFVWLYFLLKEDACHPEPRTMIALAFVVGMAAVPFAIPLEQYAKTVFGGGLPDPNLSVLTVWALIEELLKYVMAAAFILWRPVVDEAPDYVIYMLTVALGFAAAENMLFLLTPLSNGQMASTIFTGDMRFVGATLLHVIASGAVGFAIAIFHGRHSITRVTTTACGLILAIALHTVFNTLMITEGTPTTLSALSFVWIVAVIFLAAFEVLKYFQYRNLPPNSCQS